MTADPTALLTRKAVSCSRASPPSRPAAAWPRRNGCAASTRPNWSRSRWRSVSCAWRPWLSSAGRRRCCSPGPGTSSRRRKRSPATAPLVFGDAALGRVADLCCGIGGDLIALAGAGEALAVDRDETHARLARHNAEVYGEAGRCRRGVRRAGRPPGGTRRGVHRPGSPLRPGHRLGRQHASAGQVASAGSGTAFAGRGAPATVAAATSGARSDSAPGHPSRRSTGAAWPAR